MYINFNNLLKLPILYLPIFEAARQNANEDMESVLGQLVLEVDLQSIIDSGYLKQIKGKKNDSDLQRLRLDSKGKKWLESLSEPDICEGDEKMYDYLKDMYLSHEDEDRKIGNQKKTKLYVTKFRHMTDLNLHQMYWLCWYFLQEFEYTKVLEYVFHNSNKDRYGTFNEKTLEDSALFQFLNDRKEDVEKLWGEKIK